MPRLFTLAQAEELLPEIEPAIRGAMHWNHEYREASLWIEHLRERVTMSGGILADPARVESVLRKRTLAMQALSAAVEKIVDFGCEIRDLDSGSVAFPATVGRRAIFFCWRVGDPGIAFWHEAGESMGASRPIGDELRQTLE